MKMIYDDDYDGDSVCSEQLINILKIIHRVQLGETK